MVDETGDAEKGTHTVGVQRKTPASPRGSKRAGRGLPCLRERRRLAALDRELYIPRSWTCDLDRCRAVGLGEETLFATKPELAAHMIGRFLDAGHHLGWIAGDEVYGGNPKLRFALEERGTGYVLAGACSAETTTGAGKFRVVTLAAKVPKRAWRTSSGGRHPGRRITPMQ
ncbi:transposase [Streptomyces brasiliscabiei]|uniref:Transposase n=1 Tax=Streptomyces brasiliscabiei TaxID=2736302 RepID=A0ABU8GC87_9ACTN